MTNEKIAEVAHEVNRAYCQSLGDNSQAAWVDAPDWQKISALSGVQLHIAKPDASPEDSHAAWLDHKRSEGGKFGLVKDAEKKEHPCFLPYAELKESDKAKDFIFRAVVRALKDA